jgi:dienelactone hydrolase
VAAPRVLISRTYWGGMPFWFRRAPEHAAVESLVIRAHDLRPFRALYWSSTAHPAPKVGVVVMHPRVDFTQHYAIPRLVGAGFGVLAATTRHAGNDTLAEHEEMVLDVAACVHHLLDRRGVERVVLLGNCGGASLAAFYQAQARLPPSERLAASPAGSATHFAGAPMTPAHGVVFVAAHRGQGKILQDSIDPAVTDEADPLSVDPALDMYDPDNGFRTPPAWTSYDPAFIARYRAAQVARVSRIDDVARAHLARRGAPGASEREQVCEPIMVVYRTMANPAFVDRSIDPSERDYGSLLSERPDLMNYAALGLARTCSPRAWLSTWSGLSSNADLVANAARIGEPTLVVHAGRDREIFPSDLAALEAALTAADRRVVTIAGARHYFEPEPGEKNGAHVEALMDEVVPWIRDRFA